MKKTFATLAAFFLLGLSGASALEIKSGVIRAVIDETTARVSVYELVDPSKGRYEPLLFDADPRTSYATLSFTGKLYRLGDSADYRFTVTKTDTGARIEFRSASCVVDEDVDFVTSAGSALADGLRLTFSMTNVSEKDAAIGLRFLADTWLAEKSGLHFKTQDRPRIGDETSLDASDAASWLETPGDKADLMIQYRSAGAPAPDRVLLANWKRLNDEPWAFDTVSGRPFTLLPYSINDSAAALYWQPAAIAKGSTRTAAIILGVFDAKGYPVERASKEAATSALYAQTFPMPQGTDVQTQMAADLLTVRELLAKIDEAMANGRTPQADEIAAWQKILDRLEERKKGY